MKKSTLIYEVSKKTGIAKSEVEVVINEFLQTIIQSLKEQEAVSLRGFGSFFPIKKRKRDIYIPGTNKKITVKEKLSIKFRPSKQLKNTIQQYNKLIVQGEDLYDNI